MDNGNRGAHVGTNILSEGARMISLDQLSPTANENYPFVIWTTSYLATNKGFSVFILDNTWKEETFFSPL
jgi:hypothetical protein